MWVANVGGRDAVRAVAHLFCEIRARLAAVDLCDGDGYTLRMTQAELGEAVGISPVHANRVLQRLRADGLLHFGQGRVASPDWDTVRELAEFDPTYLHLDESPAIPA
jgi:CRP-like cAMP-binding protein